MDALLASATEKETIEVELEWPRGLVLICAFAGLGSPYHNAHAKGKVLPDQDAEGERVATLFARHVVKDWRGTKDPFSADACAKLFVSMLREQRLALRAKANMQLTRAIRVTSDPDSFIEYPRVDPVDLGKE